MFCPACQVLAEEVAEFCPACGAPLRPVAADDAVRLVEGSARSGASRAVEPVAVPEIRAGASLALARVSARAAVLWQQPAVRAAARTGASAMALSLALRLAKSLLVSRGGATAPSIVPALGDLLRTREPLAMPSRRGEPGEVLEMFVYMRRTVRH